MASKTIENVNRNTIYINDDGYGYENTSITSSESVYLDDGTYIRYDEALYIEQPINISAEVFKANKFEKLVSGWANIAKNADGSLPLDWDGDVITAEVLEKAAIDFMLEYRESGEMHKEKAIGTVVESIVFTKQKMEAMGIPEGTVPEGWFITVKIHDDDVFKKVVDGKYKMFSIQGKAKRLKV
jgi:hypothetical protein